MRTNLKQKDFDSKQVTLRLKLTKKIFDKV